MNIQNLNCLIDLHLHLDGSLPLHTVKELAEQQGITLQMTDGELKKKLSVINIDSFKLAYIAKECGNDDSAIKLWENCGQESTKFNL